MSDMLDSVSVTNLDFMPINTSMNGAITLIDSCYVSTNTNTTSSIALPAGALVVLAAPTKAAAAHWPSWPPTSGDVPYLLLVVGFTWIFITFTLWSRKSEQDEQDEKDRINLVRDRLAQVIYEHKETEKKRSAYNERKAKIEQAAAAHVDHLVAIGQLDEADAQSARAKTYDQMAREAAPSKEEKKASCFAAEQLPQRMSAEHILGAAIDEVSELPVDQLPGVHTAFGPAFAASFTVAMDEVAGLLTTRMTETLRKTIDKTSHARETAAVDPAMLIYASGQKLAEHLLLAKRVNRALRQRRGGAATGGGKQGRTRRIAARVLGWLVAPAPNEAEAAFKSTHAEARALLKQVRRQQQSRMLRMLTLLSPSTVGHLLLAYLATSINGIWGTLHTMLLADVARHAMLADDSWRPAVAQDVVAFVIIFVLEWWVNDFLSIVACNRSNSEFSQRIRKQLFDAIMRQDTVYFELNDSGAVCSRLNHDCEKVAHSFLHLPREILGNISHLVATGTLLYMRCPEMLYRALTFAVCAVPFIVVMQRTVNHLARKGYRALDVSSRSTNEMLRNLSTVREFARERQEGDSYTRTQAIHARDGIKLHLMQHMQWPIFISFFFGAQLVNLWTGAALVNAGTISAIELVQLFHKFGEITHSFKHLVDQLPRLLELMLPADRVFTILESKSSIEPNEGDAPGAQFEPINGGVAFTFEGVDFAYPTMPEHRVLRGLSLHIPAGKTVALVGERGCGKSTTIEMMKRAYDPEPGCGRILVNDVPMQNWDVRAFRKHISVVSQSVHLFAGSIRDNVLYGLSPEERRSRGFDGADGALKEEAEAELTRVTDLAGCDFISDYPLRLETRLGTGGIKLSGGQKQCIAIARALIKRPALLILDEATSALDAKTQALVAKNIESEQARLGFTVVQIAHRLETLKSSDVIYYFAHGRVVESSGLESLSCAAVDELLKVPIDAKMVPDPETGKPTRKLRGGHFHDMWNKAHGLVPPEEMEKETLVEKQSALKKELIQVESALRKKAIYRQLCIMH